LEIARKRKQLSAIDTYLFGDIYDSARKIREVNIANGATAFAWLQYGYKKLMIAQQYHLNHLK
jgi:fido (protein-threonine AMPylation protein)